MAAVANGNVKRYSWWWDSHNTPKNSKWLQENLTDMDSKVKQMIKVIEEDADSFARRAEMYYKKRPELMKLVEEFYRAYRALAERYDHATGVIRHAQQTMAEVFPNQDPMMFGEESPLGSSTDDYDPQTPDSYPPIRAPIYPNEFKKDALGGAFSHMSTVKRNIAFMEEPQSMSNGKGFQTGKARKGLNFNAVDGRNAKVLSESERASKAEAEIVALKDALSKVQAEKEANLAQFDQNLERLTYLESEVSRAQDDSKGLIERAKTAEAEVKALRESLSKLEVEKGSSLLQYQQCLQNIADLEDRISLAQKEAGEVDERASRAEAETLALKQSLARSETDKDTALVQYQQCLETISNLEERLGKAEEDAKLDNQRAENAEDEVESLKQRVSKLIEENEAYELQYQQCLDTIADLKLKLFHAQEETKRLSREIEDGVAKLKFAEEKCVILERSNQDLHSELDGLLEKLGDQSHELTEKQKEMGRLWTSVQEEHLRFMEAETAFQTLQQLHSQSQEELSTLALELQNRSQILKDMEARNNGLQEEVQEAKDANKSLSELNLSSAASIKSLQEEVSRLRETIQKLETEVELRVDQRNALQQEIYALKEELSQIGKKHQSMVEQVKLVGLHPEDFEFSVKQLQEENSKLKEIKERESIEKTALLEKLEKMEKLVQKNFLLENSISDLNAELETIRGKLKTLEEACMSLTEEKSGLHSEKDMLISRLQNATENSKKLSEENRVLEDSLFNTNAELEDIKSKLKSLEESCHMMSDENSGLTSEKESLLSEMEIMRKRIKDLEKEQAELEMKVSDLARQRESSLQKIEELGVSLDAKDREYVRFVQFSESKMNGMESKIHHLQDENECREREYQVELDRAHDFHVEILVLQKCLQDWVEKSSSLIAENQNIKGASLLLEKLVSELKLENSGKQVQIDSSINCLKILRTGIYQVLMKLEINPGTDSSDDDSQDQKNLQDILNKLDDMQTMLSKSGDENQHFAIENLVLVEFLRQLKSKAIGIETEKKILEKELESQSHQLSFSRDETQKLVLMNGELTTKVDQVVNREEVLKVDIENLQRQVLQFRDDYTTLQGENCKTLDEKAYLTKSALRLEEEKHVLEEDISLLLSETIYQSNLITLLEEVVLEKLSGAVKLTEDLDRLSLVKCKLEEEVRQVSDKLKSTEIEKSQLEGLLERSNAELLSTRSANDQLQHEIADVKDQLDHEIANVKDQLDQKDKELLEAMLMIMIFQNDRSELCKAVEGLECRYKEAKAIEEFKDNQILKLREDYDEQAKTNGDKLKSTEIEKFQLEGLLKISNAELLSARSANDQLEHEIADVKDQLDREIANVKDQLDQKDEKLLEAMLMTTIFQNERSELCKAVEGLERRYKEAKAIEESKDNHILKIRGDYDEQVKTNSDKLKSAEIEKSQLEGLLERSNAELLSAKSANDELEREIANVKDQLDQKDTKVLEAMLMITIFQNERSDICKAVEGLECRYKEAQEIEEYKDNQILKLRGDYDEQVKTNSDMLKSAEIEKSQFEGLLERSNAELLSARLANDQLEHEIADVKDELDQKDKELLEAMLMITIFQNERSELCKAVECLECKYKEAKAIEEYKDNQILKLRGDYDEQVKKNSDTSEANLKLEADLMSSLMELEEIKVKKEKLNQELVTEKNEIELWESQSATLFGDLQISTVHETLLEGLTHELAEACKNLESRITLKDMEIDQLKGRVNNLDDANKRQNDLMSKYGQAIFLLKESIASLEKHTAMPHEFENEPATDTASVVDNNNGFLEMQELCMRIKAIEEAVTKKFAMEELRNSSARRSRRRNGSLRKQNHDIYSEESEMITKDIVLDQVSDCSSYGISKREISKLEDDHSLKPQNSQKGKSLSEESLVVDKLEISDRFTDPNKDINKRKVLERLHSDLQKLSNLHIVVEDMKTKVETEEKGEKGKEDEYETIKGQINEAEEALEKLLSINRKLVTKVQSGFERSDGSKSSMDLDENESSRRRRISEQARRTSEKIGRLQLETQRLQFLLLKLEGERENGAKAKISDSKTRTLLRDYIYGGVRGERRKRIKRRFAFCGCVQQPPPSP